MQEVLQAKPDSCLDPDTISRYLDDKLPSSNRDDASQHLVSCEACRGQLTELARHGATETQSYSSVVLDQVGTGFALPPDSADGLLAPGTGLGRYVVLSKVGAGGMGIVYSAYDPELDRRIAIKVIRTKILKDTERAHESLRNEARAMAQLTHPNVVRVYDVGTQGQLVYIAMEFIEGEDLLQFAKRHQARGEWRPILDACMQAGRGLQAAHEAGLVHRDFKPSNVLVSKEGRAYVADFGLTRLFSKPQDGGEVGWTSASGTPGYAAPEQVAGKPSDVRSDQYSFCVTAAECLFGRDPMSIIIRLDHDKSQQSRCPKRLAPVLERGLARVTSGRHPSMEELLDQLQARANSARRRGIIAASTAALAGVGLLMFVLGTRASSSADACRHGAARFTNLWTNARQEKLSLALAGTGYKKHAAYFLSTAGDFANELATQQSLSCKATFKSKTQSSELFDRQMFCLNSQATELDAIVRMVEGGASVEAGQSALGSLPSVAECRVSESLLATPAPPADAESLARIQAVEDKLSQRRALEQARKPLDALKSVEEAIVEAREIGYGPLITRAEVIRAQLLETLERYPEARQAAERARDAAAQDRDTRRLVITLLRLASIVSTHEDDADEANAFLATARSLSLGIELPTIDRVQIEITSGSLAQASGNNEEAIRCANEGLYLLANVDQADAEQELDNAKASLLQIIAAAHFANNELDEAGTLLRTIHELEVKRLGPEHSDLAVSLINIATVDYKLEKHQDALELLGRARELLLSPDAKRTDLGQALSLEALIQNRLGNLSEAVTLYQQTIEVYKELYGEDHANIWRTRANLANTLLVLERWDEALEIQRGFLAWTIERYGAQSPTSVAAKLNLAATIVQVYYEEGKVQEAQVLLNELDRDLPKGDATLVGVRVTQGNAFLAVKEYSQAAAAFAQALSFAETTPNSEPSFTATTTGAYADALWQAGKQGRALEVAREALVLYDQLGGGMAEYRAEQATWLADKERDLKAH